MYERPILSRYVDPMELVWLSAAKRLGLTIRRNPLVFSATDGTGLLELGPRVDLDPDDTLAQMVLHELCHWITNGEDSYAQRDWGFELDGTVDVREHACLRLQAWLTGQFALRHMMAPTGLFREYYDRIPEDPLQPLDDSKWEKAVVELAHEAIERSQGAPWKSPLCEALGATAALRGAIRPFLDDYATEFEEDALPSLWAVASSEQG